VPSKCPQNPFALTASQKQTRKIAQFSPVASSFGTEVGRASEREAVVTADIAVHVEQEIGYLKQLSRAHNLLE